MGKVISLSTRMIPAAAFLAISASQTPRNCFCQEKLAWGFVYAVFPQAKHLQAYMYSFSANEMTHFWPFCKCRALLLVLQEIVSAFQFILREAPGAPNFKLSNDLLRGGLGRGEVCRVWILKRMKSCVEGPKRVLIQYSRSKDFPQGKNISLFSWLFQPLEMNSCSLIRISTI